MLRTTTSLLCLVITGATLTVATSPPAAAGTTWKTGIKVSGTRTPFHIIPSASKDAAYTWAHDEDCLSSDDSNGLESEAFLIYDGDDVYVADLCKDGRSAVARIQDDSGENRWICRNSSGNNTVVRCDFNWPESRGKRFIAGSHNGTTGHLKWDHGSSVLIGYSA